MNGIFIFFLLLLSFNTFGSVLKSYRIGVESFKYYPHYSNNKGVFEGYAKEILDAFAKNKGYKFDYVLMPYARIVRSLLKNKIDLQYPDNRYWLEDLKKGKKVIYSDPAVNYIDGLHVLPKNLGTGISKIKKIGTLVDFSPIQYFALEKKGVLEISYLPTVSGLIKQVHAGRIDGVYLNADVIKHYERDAKPPIIFDPSQPYISSGFSLSTINYQNIIIEFNKFLKENRTLVLRIKKKYKLK